MKKSIQLLLVAVFTALMTLPQQAMAKEKKVKYLGHYYNGEVNKKKIPEGHGVMNIGGLLIEGIFDDHSATDAEVNIWDFHNCQFKGNITYDSSNNITLKAGGVFTTEYYEETWKYVDTDAEIVEEVLEVDRVVNINSFERKTLEIPCRTGLNFGDRTIDSLINLNELVIPVKLQEKSFYYSNLTNPVQKNIFICPKRIETLHNYKDPLGRIINYSSSYDYSVVYPNGDRFTDKEWQIVYPNGKIIKWSGERISGVSLNIGWIDLGNGLLVAENRIDAFWKYREMNEFHLTSQELSVYDKSFDRTTSVSTVERTIREKLTPYIENFNLDEHKVNIGYDDISIWGWMENGKCISKLEQEQTAKEQEREQEQEAYERLCRKYGKKYVDAYYNGVPAVGMPEELLKKGFTHKVAYQSGSSKTYYLLPWPGADDYKRVFTVYVSNGKVTSFRDHR